MSQSMMRQCKGPRCKVTCRHWRVIDDQGRDGWRCDNCGTFNPISVQGQNTPKAIQAIMDKLEFKHEYGQDRWSGYVTLDELRMLLQHSTMRDVKATAGPFGLVALSKRDIFHFCNDDFRKKRQQRLEEKTGRPVEVSVILEQSRKASGWTHSLLIFGFYAFSDDKRENYYHFD